MRGVERKSSAGFMLASCNKSQLESNPSAVARYLPGFRVLTRYLHGHLQPENILLDDTRLVQVCDLGRTQKRDARLR
jgi:Ser/Thr protein kinase RdoA (MazF antagonist)